MKPFHPTLPARGHALVGLLPLLGACAVAPYVDPAVAGRPAAEVSRIVTATEAPLFPCTLLSVAGDASPQLGPRRPEATLAPGRYDVTLDCASAYHSFKPRVSLVARPGKVYRLTGYLVDNSITIFTMRMGIKVAEVAP